MEKIKIFRAGSGNAMFELAGEVGWNQTLCDCDFLTSSDAAIAVYAESGGQVVGCAAVTLYGRTLGFLNMVIVREPWRGRGIASSMLKELMTLAPCGTYRLHATEKGAPVYRKLGFVPSGETVYKYFAPNGIPARPPSGDYRFIPLSEPNAFAESVEYDGICYGLRRERVLAHLAGQRPLLAFLLKRAGLTQGYCVGRLGPRARHIALSADSCETAAALFEHALSIPCETPKLQLLAGDSQTEFGAYLLSRGFEKSVPMLVMEFGKECVRPSGKCRSLPGGEFG